MSITLDINKQIAKVTLNRPEVHNAFNEEMVQSLIKTFTELGKNNDVRVVILSSSGKTFCSGADLKWMRSMVNCSFDENIKDAMRLGDMLKSIFYCSKPVICRVQGPAFGGGVGIISACDMAVAVESATFSLSEVKIGLIPAVISPFVLLKMPPSYAQRYFLTAEKFGASEAQKMGLISEVVSSEEALDELVMNFADAICLNAPEATSLSKKQIHDIFAKNLEEEVRKAAETIAERRASKEGQEGMNAFFEKRTPNWVK